RLMANANGLQDTDYVASLLVNMEAARGTPTLDSSYGLLQRLGHHPHFQLGHNGEVPSVAFSPDRKRLASASKEAVILWDVNSGKPLATLMGHKGTVDDVAFSRPDGKLLASASTDGTVKLWDVDSGEPLDTLEGHESAVRSVAFSPDGKRLASASAEE